MVGEVFAQGCNQIFQIEGGPNVKVEEGVIEKLIWIDYKSIFFFWLEGDVGDIHVPVHTW